MLLILNLLFCGYLPIKTISVFENVKQPFKINGIRYRESINPIFVLDSVNENFLESDSSETKEYGNIMYGKNQLKDIVISDTWKKIDNILVFNSEDTLFRIIGTTKIEKDIPIDYKIMDNSNVLFKEKTSKFQHFSTYLIDYGLHNITLWARSSIPTCICSSKGNGFINSYQLAIWKSNNNKQIDVYNYSLDIDLINYNLISNERNKSYIEKYQTNILDKPIHSSNFNYIRKITIY